MEQAALFASEPEPARTVVTVHTDGGCDPNPGPGGWAAVLSLADREVTLCGNAPDTTNNRMELEAAIAAMAYLAARYGKCEVELYTDSTYLHQGIDEWIDDWFARGWKTKTGEAVKNQDLWRDLYRLAHTHQVRWHWVKGHAGDPQNERVDVLAREARQRLPGDTPAMRPSPPPGQGLATPVEVWVGVSSSGGSGGWAAVVRSGEETRTLSGSEAGASGNALLIQAAVATLEALDEPCAVTVYTDADYLGRGASEWAPAWQRQRWLTRAGKPVSNQPLWEALLRAAASHQVTWQIIRGDLPPELAAAKQAAAEQAR
jgi:ribonuclease HI